MILLSTRYEPKVEKFFTLPIKYLELLSKTIEIYNLEIKRDGSNFLTKTDLVGILYKNQDVPLNDLEIQNRALLDNYI